MEILPLAEKIRASDIYRPADMGVRIMIPFKVFYVMLVVSMMCLVAYWPLGVFLFGLLFILGSLDKGGSLRRNGRVEKNNFWNSLPLFIIGLLAVFAAVAYVLAKLYHEDYHLYVGIAIKIYLLVLAAIIIGRFIFLVVEAYAISRRKKCCTYIVSVERDDAYLSDPTQNYEDQYIMPLCKYYKPLYKYFYNGECYRLTADDSLNSFFNSQNYIKVHIDPDMPERFYSPLFTRKNVQNLESFSKTAFITIIVGLFLKIIDS